jgi:hypothetical protein
VLDVVSGGGGKLADDIVGVRGIGVANQAVRFRMEPFPVYIRTVLHDCVSCFIQVCAKLPGLLEMNPGNVSNGLITKSEPPGVIPAQA